MEFEVKNNKVLKAMDVRNAFFSVNGKLIEVYMPHMYYKGLTDVLKTVGRHLLINEVHNPKEVPDMILETYGDLINLILDLRARVEYETDIFGGRDL